MKGNAAQTLFPGSFRLRAHLGIPNRDGSTRARGGDVSSPRYGGEELPGTRRPRPWPILRHALGLTRDARNLLAALSVIVKLSAALLLCGFATARALEWQPRDGYRCAPLPVPSSGQTGFTRLMPAVTGITFTNWLSDERSLTNRNLLSGSGVAAGDIDGDGWCDLYFCSLGTGNMLYRNLG